MPRLNFAEPTHAAAQAHPLAKRPLALNDEEVVRLSTLGMTTLEVAHDLGNLLQVTGSAVRMIDRSLTSMPAGAVNPLVSAALASIERAAALSRRILDAARPCRDARTLYPDTVLKEMLDEIVLAAGSDVDVILDIGPCVPAIACHRPDLENVMLNLAVNARDAMPAGGRLTLGVHRDPGLPSVAQPRPDVLITVADTGCGMSEAIAAQAFKPFFTTKPGHRGTGLGLAMVGAFARRLGGGAEIVSQEGVGTAVLLHLPSCAG